MENQAPTFYFLGWCYQPSKGHDKVWEVKVTSTPEGGKIERRWGRRGGPLAGQVNFKPTFESAKAEAEKLVISKTRAGRRTGQYFEASPEALGMV